MRFAERLKPLGLTPAESGILWNLHHQPNLTQRALAELLGAFPSRLVLLIDQLENKGLVQRHPDPTDRRSHCLRLTAAGKAQLDALRRVSREHQDGLFTALNSAERERLCALLARVAEQQGLRPRVHPGFGKT